MDSKEDSIEEFVHELTRSQNDLFYFIRALCGDAHAAADIRQAVNMILWRKREKFKPGTSFKNWAFRVAQLEVKSYLRQRKKSKLMSFDGDLLDCFASELPATIDEFPERRTALLECLKKLTPKDDELIRHHYWSGGSLATLARATERSVGTLKARLFQLRGSLRKCIRGQLNLKES
ncbi:sigma-70 family RNA polymerase sigma factor [Luteolibacter marinus]|uniref:sigma-70 family RNA polymerase sigma factor n=1 Tax=Luteolibacter marinus TaxID=2776705 RepID=UPI00186951C4|nr:sigma-70 family RNA polymerase sigma factor [Luteolibacter marinus]